MGREIDCDAEVNGKRLSGRALLETEEIVFRSSGARTVVPLKSIVALTVEEDDLVIDHILRLHLGRAEATRWIAAVKNPKGRIDKLGVKAGQRVAVLGVVDATFAEELRARAIEATTKPPYDIVFFAANATSDLARLATLKKRIVDDGAIWIIRPKGVTTITERDVMAKAKEAGLVDVKVVKFSDTHTAEKLVIPVASRGTKRA